MGVIEETIQVIDWVTEQSKASFSELTIEPLNWKPAPDRWSAGQCLDHMMAAHRSYIPIFDQVRSGQYPERAWERVPLLPTLFGRSLVDGLSRETTRLMKAPAVFWPSKSDYPVDVIPRFLAHQDELAAHMRELREADLGHIITSPANRWVVYSLRDTCRIIKAHEALHFRQAKQTLELYNTKKS